MALSVRFHSPYLPPYAQDPLPLILDTMASAHRTLDLCLSSLTLAPLVERAAEISRRGVKVRWVIDLGNDAAAATERLLTEKGFRKQEHWRAFRGGQARLSQNFMVIDGHRILGNTSSWAGEGLYLQDNVDFVLDSVDTAAAYLRAMNAYWNELESARGEPGAKGSIPEYVPPSEGIVVGPEQRVSSYFGPYDGRIVREKLLETISEAETSIHFAFPSLSDPQLVDALEERAGAGLHVSGVLDAHRARVEHFARAPRLRALVKSGRIRMMHSFALEKGQLLDGMQAKLVAIDNQYVYLSCSQFDPSHRVAYVAESALSIDSGPVARQAAAYLDALLELAGRGGHFKEECRTFGLYLKTRGGKVSFEAMPARKKPAPATRPSRQAARLAPGVSAPKTTGGASAKGRRAAARPAAAPASARKATAARKKPAAAKAKPAVRAKPKAKSSARVQVKTKPKSKATRAGAKKAPGKKRAA